MHVKDIETLNTKLNKIKQHGNENLMIVSDFDQTISLFRYPASMEIERAQRLGMEQCIPTKLFPAESAMKVLLACDKITDDVKTEY